MTGTVALTANVVPSVGLPERLGRETVACHREVEAGIDIVGTVRTRADYVRFLLRLYLLRAGFERLLAADVWAAGWSGAGVRIGVCQRAEQLRADFTTPGDNTTPCPIALPSLPTFAHALLPLLEGSALGGRDWSLALSGPPLATCR